MYVYSRNASNIKPLITDQSVALTSASCKILEHLVHRSIIDHFIKNNTLCDNQHDFRSKRSCETHLISTMQGIASNLQSGKDQVDVILLDFSKPFNKEPHRRLLHKLDLYGVRGDTLGWLLSFLSYRKQQKKQVSIIRKYHNHTPQTNPLHCEEKPKNTGYHKTSRRQLKQATSSLLSRSK